MRHDDGHGFKCNSSPTGRCNGQYTPELRLIQVLDSLSAFNHELVHHLTGADEGDEVLLICGDGINVR